MNIDTALKEAMSIPGTVGGALVDYESGMSLGTPGGGDWLNLELAAAIEDILITLHRQHHLIRMIDAVKSRTSLFLYLVLEKDVANIALARHQLKRIESDLQI